jgi:hypothetical protein
MQGKPASTPRPHRDMHAQSIPHSCYPHRCVDVGLPHIAFYVRCTGHFEHSCLQRFAVRLRWLLDAIGFFVHLIIISFLVADGFALRPGITDKEHDWHYE